MKFASECNMRQRRSQVTSAIGGICDYAQRAAGEGPPGFGSRIAEIELPTASARDNTIYHDTLRRKAVVEKW